VIFILKNEIVTMDATGREKTTSPEWHTLDSTQVFKELNASEKGLSEAEARERIQIYGSNELRKEKGISPLILFISQFRNFLVLILIVAAGFSFAIGAALDGVVISIIVILNALFGFVQEFRAGKAIEALKRLTSPESLVLRDGRKKKIPSRLLVPGDVVFLEEGSKIPADLRLLETVNLKIDEAPLTGESIPVTKSTAALSKAILAERKNICYTGTHVTYGRGRGIVVGTGMETEIGKIASLIEEVKEEATPLQKKLRVFGKNLGILILGISGIVIVGGDSPLVSSIGHDSDRDRPGCGCHTGRASSSGDYYPCPGTAKAFKGECPCQEIACC